MLKIFFSIFLFLSFINNSFALNNEKLDQLSELMFLTCSLGNDTTLKFNAEGNLMLLKKGVKGNFEANRSQLPNIIN